MALAGQTQSGNFKNRSEGGGKVEWNERVGGYERGGVKKERGRRRPTLPRSRPRSTIGAEELNDRVRDGNGCGLLARAAAPKLGTGVIATKQGFFMCVFQDRLIFLDGVKKKRGYGQASRPIRIG